MARVPAVPRSGPGRWGSVPLPRGEVGGRPSETSRNPCEGHPDQRATVGAVRDLAVSDEKPRFAPVRRDRSATGRKFHAATDAAKVF